MSHFASTEANIASKTLSDASVSELIEELMKRGVKVTLEAGAAQTSTASPDASRAAIAQTVNQSSPHPIYEVLEAMQLWTLTDRHRNDRDRSIIESWTYFRAYDWDRKPKGYSCDANKSVEVGLGEFNKFEDCDAAQILLILHYDSERPGNYAKRNQWGKTPPVWGIAFSAAELRSLAKDLVDNAATKGTLIHREPEGEVEENEPWWQETHWLIENGKISGVKICIKLSQDLVHNTELIRFKVRGNQFEFIGKEEIKNAAVFPNVNIPLPEALPWLIPSREHLQRPVSKDDESANSASGSSDLEVKFCGNECEAYNYDDGSWLYQNLTSPVLMLTNPTDTRVAITDFFVEMFSEKDGWSSCPSHVGFSSMSYYGHRENIFMDTRSFEVEPHSSLEIVVKGTMKMEKGGLSAYNGRPFCNRIHSAFPDPLKARVRFVDDANRMKEINFSHRNEPLTDLWNTYEEAVASGVDREGFGPEYEPLLWLCLENPLTLNKCMILVSMKLGGGDRWFVKMSNDSRGVGGSVAYLYPSNLQRLAYTAMKEGNLEIDLDLGDNKNCKLTGLVDYDTRTVYALHGIITISDSNNLLLGMAEAYLKLDYSKIVSGN